MATWRHSSLPETVSTGAPAPGASRRVERIGSPAIVAALALLVVVGLGITVVVLVRSSLAEARDSRRSVEITRISDSSIALLAALQRERGLGELYLASGDPSDQADYEATFPATDEVAEEFSDTWVVSGGALRQEEQGALSGVAATLAPLGEVRSAVTNAEAEAPVDLYSALVEPIHQTLSDVALLTTDAEDVRMRRAVLALLDASSSLATRRAVVARLLASSEEITRQQEIQLSILAREVDVNLRAAQALLTEEERTHIAGLTDSAEAGAVVGMLERIVSGERGDATPQSWFAIATAEIDLIHDSAVQLNDAVRDSAVDGIAEARRAVTLTIVLVGSLFVLSILAAWSAITASRERCSCPG